MLENYYNEKELKKFKKTIVNIRKMIAEYNLKEDLDLEKEMINIKSSKMSNNEKIYHAMALADLASIRTTQKNYYDVQFMGGLALSEGKIAQMKTGEGKTLMCSLGVAANFVLGFKTHVSTANEYLAKRDQETLQALYTSLGITSSYNISTKSKQEKRESYNSDVMYSTATEKGFDYLRDNLVTHIDNKIQPLDFMKVAAIIDEADFILIDEARTPLIISGEADSHSDSFYQLVREVALNLKQMSKEPEKDISGNYIYEPGDYWIDFKTRGTHLSEEGYDSMEKLFKQFNLLGEKENLYMPSNAWMLEHVLNAIKAENLYIRDKQYVVYRNEIVIVDEHTGRLSDGRRWSDGLHQAIEAKEGLQIQSENSTLRSISIQNFYRHYGKISGMTGTAQTCSEEFLEVYGTLVIAIPTNEPIARIDKSDRLYMNSRSKYKAIMEDIVKSHANKQPILVATTSVVESELISNMLNERNIFHYVLNAKNHALEAQIIAQAGIAGSVTVSTSMAGRGTDIILGGNKEEIINMRKQQLQRTVVLRNYLINTLIIQKALIPGENLAYYTNNWNNMIIIEEFLDKTLNSLDSSKVNSIEDDKLTLGTLAHLEIFLNNEIKNVSENWDKAREEAINAGGLYVLGCSRNETRRIDDQIKGRSGRQGDIGKSCFYISFEDSWLTAFGESKIIQYIKRRSDEDTMLDDPMLSKAVTRAQKNSENLHYEGRKNTVKFDSVLNEARIQFFSIRDEMISGSPLLRNILLQEIHTKLPKILDFDYTSQTKLNWKEKNYFLSDLLDKVTDKNTPIEDKQQIIIQVIQNILNVDIDYIPTLFQMLFEQGLSEKIASNDLKTDENIVYFLQQAIDNSMNLMSEDTWKFYFSSCLTSLDKAWVNFISITDEIKDSSQLSAFAQKNPVYVYKTACFDIFEDLIMEFKNNLINIFLDSKIEFDEMNAKEIIRQKNELQRSENLSKEITYIEPEDLIVDIDPSLIFHKIDIENSTHVIVNNMEQEIPTLVEPENFILDIESNLIFNE